MQDNHFSWIDKTQRWCRCEGPLLSKWPLDIYRLEKLHKKRRKVFTLRLLEGWKMGLEPTTLGTTILYSDQLSYIHHFRLDFSNRCANIEGFGVFSK